MEEKPKKAFTNTPPKKVYLASLGCPKNLVDSEVMLGQLATNGFELTQNQKEAEVIIVNTCGFLQASVKESLNTILDLAKEKESGSCAKLVVTGCLSQRYQGELPKELQEVDLFIGTNDYPKIAELLDPLSPPFEKGGLGGFFNREYIHPPLYIHNSETPRLLATQPHTAYVKIAEGCNHICSFCIIPKLRGKQRSRPIEDIRREIENLISMGCKEFNLIAQDTTDYGHDLHNGTNIEKLLIELSRISGDHWFRLMYAYPLRFSDELIDIMATSKNICRYIDIPFQHINDHILKSMHRGSKGLYIRKLIERLRTKIPEMAIRSTFIVGYPGETDGEFKELLNFLHDAELERVGVFTYSHEEGTEAAQLSAQVSEKIKRERRKILMELQQEISLKKNRRRLRQKLKVLTDRSLETDRALGRTEWDAPEIDGAVEFNGREVAAGSFYQVTVTKATPYKLFAELFDVN